MDVKVLIPHGWKLVPVEPTDDMLDAAGMGWIIKPSELRKRIRIYQAMVNAASTPTTQLAPERDAKPERTLK